MGFNYIRPYLVGNNMYKNNDAFEQIGINYQHDAISIEDANNKFARSCYACCHKGRNVSCDRCGIAVAHNLVVAIFKDLKKEA
jgi:hypothetical protein